VRQVDRVAGTLATGRPAVSVRGREIRVCVSWCLYAASMHSADGGLSERDVRVLDFEESWWLYPQPKDRAIKEYLGMSAARYYQILRRVVEDGAALQYAPMTVRRLRRVQRTQREAFASRAGDADR
jgi:hypothetical protein